ncbi:MULTISPECIES: hypothetical protein [Roseobacteraceae]|jgi:hypothetical protein|uniref:Uncharacterized protein n=1 Tax=Pseudosulfitobacter pseudonitzschiae TaxID=1402135 RepID=A0A221K574_9RHOB|nr:MULTISPECIES: hypothetical protein [Roseobacteraceae]ASM73997.1 hypothetical protein SULPSESMR1_03220 [Pseudosulfitobacter pseudonitzschiae]
MTTSNSFQERLKRLEAKNGQPALAGTAKPAPVPKPDATGGAILMTPKTLMIAFGGVVALVVVGSVLTVLLTIPN